MFGDLVSTTVLSLVALLIAIAYFYVKYLYSYWERRGVPYLKPTFPFGNFGKSIRLKLTMFEQLQEFYNSTSKPFIGVYSFFRPQLIVRDPELIRTILIKDFQHFVDRGVYVDEKNDPLSAHLFSIEGDKWRNLRTKLSPTFTSGKMRAIFSTLLDCGNQLLKYLDKMSTQNKSVEVREMTACYTTNGIASVAFGIDIDCFAEPNNPFRKYGRQFYELNMKNTFRGLCLFLWPKLLSWSKIHVVDREIEEFLFDVVKQTLELREQKNIVRKDFFQLLVQLRNTGNVQLDDEFKTVIANENNKTLTVEEMTAQSFVFYAAGFETSSATMSFCLYEVARNPEIQRNIQAEIDKSLAENNNKFTYESLNELKYLEACIDETLRKYSVVPALIRKCTKEYTLPGTNITLEKETVIQIPVFAIQRDEKYYPDPLKFDPSRFLSENRSGKTIVDQPYLPFGDGPRNCIGMRMGKMSTKVGIVSMLQKYNISLTEEQTDKELKLEQSTGVLMPKTGITLMFKARKINA